MEWRMRKKKGKLNMIYECNLVYFCSRPSISSLDDPRFDPCSPSLCHFQSSKAQNESKITNNLPLISRHLDKFPPHKVKRIFE
jgi:hypothetical protein